MIYERYEVVLGPNTKQYWIYDNDKDTYIDIPISLLEKIEGLENDEVEDVLLKEINKNPSWLHEEDYIYDADSIEI